MKRQVAGRALRAELVVGQSVERDVVAALADADGALALEGVLVEPHAEVKDLPALEAADLKVPRVPAADAQPEIVGVGAADVRARDRLIAGADQLDLPLDEVIAVERVGGRDARQHARLLLPVLDAARLEIRVRAPGAELLVRGVDPSPARDADDERVPPVARRHVRPLQPVERQPQRPVLQAANLRLGIRRRRQPLDADLGDRVGRRRGSRSGRGLRRSHGGRRSHGRRRCHGGRRSHGRRRCDGRCRNPRRRRRCGRIVRPRRRRRCEQDQDQDRAARACKPGRCSHPGNPSAVVESAVSSR